MPKGARRIPQGISLPRCRCPTQQTLIPGRQRRHIMPPSVGKIPAVARVSRHYRDQAL
ncbi:uncharacterized protein BDZ83DRAFT_627017 [Colletotrichum acutatum]|uniref:Uncharacterized protein n=1 Tax=Glomerella acutata TaxID=27357 RepID=A0AAD8UK54_GLOAC|nr:uncharacterized protein BDZ83DRAFT_627017 [Colletotrichum acutatum]KAK1723244.1 hypothetical protein BDZ83DRAFT_627017 [Colletotrichum acutatum]